MNIIKFYFNLLFQEMTKWNNQMIKLIDMVTHQINCETYIIHWWIWGNRPLITTMIWFWSECDGDHMLNTRDEEVWCF